jgi:hypothetical protein
MSQRSSKRPAKTRRLTAGQVDQTDGPEVPQHNFERARRARERRQAADSSPPKTRTEAIYRALVALGDPSAPSRQVSQYVRTTWPEQSGFTQDPNWNQFVTQTRDRAARALGIERRQIQSGGRRPAEPGAATDVSVPHLLSLLQVRAVLRDPERLNEVVSLISGITPPQRLTQATAALDELLKRHGDDAIAVQRFLEDFQQLGIRPT